MSTVNYIITFTGGDVRTCKRDGDLYVAIANTAMAWAADDPRIVKVKRL
jgi:hypothetical protein